MTDRDIAIDAELDRLRARIAELDQEREQLLAKVRFAAHLANSRLEELQLAERTPQADANEREIIEGMADDWLERYEPGSDEWAQAQVIRAWLENYSGTMYAERTPVAATPQGKEGSDG